LLSLFADSDSRALLLQWVYRLTHSGVCTSLVARHTGRPRPPRRMMPMMTAAGVLALNSLVLASIERAREGGGGLDASTLLPPAACGGADQLLMLRLPAASYA
jgi:hypothetical protein